MANNVLTNKKPSTYMPSFIKSVLNGNRAVKATFENASLTNAESTSSFKYDLPGEGLKSTQQLNTDFSRFENHTFFNSAEVNVNVAFDNIINGYPFDGTLQEFERFFDKLTGFEKWVYDKFPKNKGYLFFSSSAAASEGTRIVVNDFAGGLFPELSKLRSGEGILDPGEKSFSVEFKLFLPSQAATANSVICQKLSGTNHGFSFDIDTGNNVIAFTVVSGSNRLQATASLTYGTFNHYCGIFNKNNGLNIVQVYKDLVLTGESTTKHDFGPMNFASSPLTIGSGSSWSADGYSFTPVQTLSGALDEFRFFHEARTIDQLKAYHQKAIFAAPELKLYFKFNEPTGTLGHNESDTINSIVLDSSGNSLHSLISGYTSNLRNTASIEVPMLHEKMSLSPVLFPAHPDVIDLNIDLLGSASIYDEINPNLITKLIPVHYLLESQDYEGLDNEVGGLGNQFSGSSIPGSGKLGTSQMMLTFMYVWAKYFDELKMHIDAFSKIRYVDYDSNETVPDNFLPQLTKHYGFHVPSFFADASIEQFIEAENIQDDISTSEYSLRFVQNQILRRILINMQEIIRSKGTLHGVKSFIRSMGVDPDNSFRIREFGGPTQRSLTYSRESKSEIGTMLSMSLGATVTSPYLTSSRYEVGFPQAVGNMLLKSVFPPHGVSDASIDGLLTSGSWTYEAIYKYPINQKVLFPTQSLMRMHVTGTKSALSGNLVANLIAISASTDSESSRIKLFLRPDSVSPFDGNHTLSQAPMLQLELNDINVFGGDKWNISFGRFRNDEISNTASSSYFLRAARQSAGTIIENYVTSSYFYEVGQGASFFEVSAGDISTMAGSSIAAIGAGSVTVEAWVHLSSTATAESHFGLNNASSLGIGTFSIISLTDLNLYAYVQTGAGTAALLTFTSYFTNYTSQWVHVCIVLDSSTSTAYAYRNGQLFGSTATVWNIVDPSFFWVGAYSGVRSGTASEKISHARAYTRALSASEVYDRYHYLRNDSVINANLECDYPLTEGSGLIANDVSGHNRWLTLASTSDWYQGSYLALADSILQNSNPLWNGSGSYVQIGNRIGQTLLTQSRFLDDTTYVTSSEARSSRFEGFVSQVRFWSKAVSDDEWKEHVRNFKSIGTKDPLTNFNFGKTTTGSWSRLRLDCNSMQPELTSSVNGSFRLFDFSQNNFHLSGSGFPTSSRVIIPESYSYSYISPNFDENVSIDKVRIRSFQEDVNINSTPWAEVAPVTEITPSERPTDDVRFSIEFSAVDSLNKDIINIFATLDSLDNILGNPELMFAGDYPGLEQLRNIYFNRLTEKINIKGFFEFFHWFSTSIGAFIDQLIPRKTVFYGSNFVIESHMLERPKLEHLNNNIYLAPETRSRIKDILLLQQITGLVKRY